MAILKAPFVLAVHENAAIRSLIQTILRHAGYGVLAVATGNEAARLLRQGRTGIRLLIVDQGRDDFPGWLGPDGRRGSLKVLYLTAFRSLAERVSDALRHPESGFLAKPFGPQALLDLVEALIGPAERAGRAGSGDPGRPSREAFSAAPIS